MFRVSARLLREPSESRFIPTAENKFRERLSLARLAFRLLKMLGQRLGIAEVTDRPDGDGLEIVGDGEGGVEGGFIETGHAVRVKTQRGRLQGEIGTSGPDIVLGHAVGRVVVAERFLGKSREQYWSSLRPGLIHGHERGEDFIPRFIALSADDESPGLLVE